MTDFKKVCKCCGQTHSEDGSYCADCHECSGECEFPHARAFGEALGTRLGATLPSIGTYTVGKATPVREYRATFARGAKGITAPIHAELQATIFAPSYFDAERCAEHIARDGVCYLIACGIVQ